MKLTINNLILVNRCFLEPSTIINSNIIEFKKELRLYAEKVELNKQLSGHSSINNFTTKCHSENKIAQTFFSHIDVWFISLAVHPIIPHFWAVETYFL